jgi:long-chain acyl-CoA synthetase
MEKTLTGYPHIDKPWMKYYDIEKSKMKLPKKTIYENIRDNNQKNLNNIAMTYNGEQISYCDFLENIKISAKILTAIDISSGDRILYLMANIPETAYTLYGTNLIGAVSDYVDPRPDSLDFNVSSKKILDIIKKEKIDHIVALDQCYLAMIKPIENQLKEIGINKVLLISASDSMSYKGQLNYIDEYVKFNGIKATINKLKKIKAIEEQLKEAISTSCIEIIHYNDMICNVKEIQLKQLDYKPNNLTAITHSSGTSGTFPKAIPLTNEGIISYGFQLARSNTNTNFGDSSLQILPFFSAYGLGIGNFGYSMGYNMIQVPEFSPNNLGKLIKKYKPNAIMGTPNWYLSLPNDKALNKCDLSFIKTIGYGGDSMNMKDEEVINKFLVQHNCLEKVTKGHGMSEISGGSSYAIGEYNKLGSVGIPMIDTIYGIVDPDTKKIIKFEEGQQFIQGELIMSSPAIVSETLDGHLVIKHGFYDGIEFIYTGDIGMMDRNGILTFLSRSDRAFTRYDGFKVKPFEIENCIKKINEIKDCVITPYFDEEKYGNLIQANILIDNNLYSDVDYDLFIRKIVEESFIKNSNVSTRQIPTKFVIKNVFPITKNGKINFNDFNNIESSDIVYNVYMDETSISVGNISIERRKEKIVKCELQVEITPK